MADKKKEDIHQCVRCAHVSDDKDKYCTKCGAPLINRCSDEPGLVSKGCKHVNKPTAAFCAKCGEKTLFNKEGLVDPYQPDMPWIRRK
ncbi:hypothetical protein EV207_11136 [Scopulibacillus darangshiensis]|uniref:Uncharacterized protein n=1 Tax=Scopulibacillus darangshiensis TaxID=442528 RepID=A0A4V2SMZ8_9BACL|nr:zinc ribbon domain-containing protein [Scopulibacillus darangshiensis]TCP29236.1 hypothetical protein EV207_11136 [Scopulibacillus darangshiensis]